MQRVKSIQNLSEIESFSSSDSLLLSTYQITFAAFRFNGINRMLNGVKSKGLCASNIFQTLFVLPFLDIKNIFGLFKCGVSAQVIGDDNAYYRFLNNPLIPWRRIITAFVRQFSKAVVKASFDTEDEDHGPKCLICDDTLLPKKGFKIEAIGKVFDHCSHKYLLGMKLLVMGLWDGKSFVPIDFSLHHEPGKSKNRGLNAKQLKAQHKNERPHDSPGQKRISEVGQSKITMAIEMVKRAAKSGMHFDYVLADSWFICHNFIQSIRSIALQGKKTAHVIGLMKTNRKVSINGKIYVLNKIPQLGCKPIKRCKKLKCQYIPFILDYKGIQMRVFLIRMNGQRSWKALVCTDQKLSFIKAMKIYQIRWAIEVFFKDAKQHLYLGKCQSTNFDAQIASISLCLMNYTALAYAKRLKDYESIGVLFLQAKDLILKDHLVKRIWKLIITIYAQCLNQLGVALDMFIKQIINSNTIRDQITNMINTLMKLNYA